MADAARKPLLTSPADETPTAAVREPLTRILKRAEETPLPARQAPAPPPPATTHPAIEAFDQEAVVLERIGAEARAQHGGDRETPAAGRAAASAIGVAIEQVAADVRAKLEELHRVVEMVEQDAHEFIAEIERRGQVLQERIEGFTRLARGIQASIKNGSAGLGAEPQR